MTQLAYIQVTSAINNKCGLSLITAVMSGSRGGSGVSLKNHKNKGFLSNTGPDSLKTTKLPSQHSMLGHYRPTSEKPFKWRFAGGPMMAAYSGIWIFPPLINQKKTKKNVKVGPPLTKFLDPRMAVACITNNIDSKEQSD